MDGFLGFSALRRRFELHFDASRFARRARSRRTEWSSVQLADLNDALHVSLPRKLSSFSCASTLYVILSVEHGNLGFRFMVAVSSGFSPAYEKCRDEGRF